MNKIHAAFLFFSIALSSLGQSNEKLSTTTPEYLETLFNSGKTFKEIILAADQHFAEKYPGLSKSELCTGEHRDGDYVKYQRWQAFWSNNLNEDGTLGDFTQTSNTYRGLDETNSCTGDEYLVNWTNLNYNSNMGLQIDQGRTSSLAFHPTDVNTFYVGASFGGLWKTTDGGASYSILNDDLPLAAISGIAIDQNNPDNIAISLSDIVWYGPNGIGVYVSNDGGVTFSPSSLTWEISQSNKIYYMDQDPSNSSSIMIATTNGLYKTTDFFNTHTLVQSGNMRHVTYSQSDPNLVFAGGNNGQLYRSTDGGDSFTLVTDFGNGQVRIAVPLLSNSTNVVATNGTYLQRSTDNGLNFTQFDLPENSMVVEFEPQSETILNVGNFEVYRSDDFGSSFTPVSHWLGNGGLPFIHVDQRNVFVNPLENDYVYFCNDGGIFRYDNNLDEFANLSSDLIITQYYDIAVSQNTELVLGGGSQDNGNIFRAANGSWDSYAETGDGMGQDIDPVDSDTRYWSYQNGALRRWQGGGNTNIAPPNKGGNGDWETPFKLDPNNSNRLIVGYDSVFASIDQGDTWTSIGGLVNSGNVQQIAIAASNSDRVYASRESVVYKYDYLLDNWELQPTPFLQKITDLEVDHLDEDVVYISYAGFTDGKKIYRSEDGGDSWTNITYNLPNLPFLSLEPYEDVDGGIFVGTYGAVYYLDNTTTEWKKYGCIPNTAVHDIEIQYFTSKIFLGTHGRGIFEGDIEFNVSSIDEEESDQLSGLIVYPNPTSDYLLIQGQKGGVEGLQVEATDILGRSAQINYWYTETGELKVDCTSLSAGQYILTLSSSANKTESFKFTVL